MDSVDSMDLSSTVRMLSGKMDCWSWSVDAADAKKLKVPASEHSVCPSLHLGQVAMLVSIVYYNATSTNRQASDMQIRLSKNNYHDRVSHSVECSQKPGRRPHSPFEEQ